MTTTCVDGYKISVSLELSVERDEKTGGYLIAEQDGPRVVKWGPMPFSLIEAFVRERSGVVAWAIKHHFENLR